MIIDNVNLNLLRIFECVYRTKSMTKAAQELHMTQSGVSQNIKTLEDVLEVKLFNRVKQRPVPTNDAKFLFDSCSKNLYDIDRTLIQLKGGEGKLAGTISIGMPVDFGNHRILPILAGLADKYPHISFKFIYGYASEMNNALLRGDVDFAFVDTNAIDKRLKAEKVQDEVLVLCASKEYIKQYKINKSPRRFFENMAYVDYIEHAPLVSMWFKHHYRKHTLNLKVRASLMNDQGLSRLILLGVGAGVLPMNVIKHLESTGRPLYQFPGTREPLTYSISVAYLENHSLNPAVTLVQKYIIDHLKGLSNTNNSDQSAAIDN